MADCTALAVTSTGEATVVHPDGRVEHFGDAEARAALMRLDAARPRWLWWNGDSARAAGALGLRPTRCWDLGAVHRLLAGGWHSSPADVWAHLRNLDAASIPSTRPVDLFTQADDRGDVEDPVGTDGHLRPDWVEGGWAESPLRRERWLHTAHELRRSQELELERRAERDDVGALAHLRTTAFAESLSEVMCAELEHCGLPVDRAEAEAIVAGFVGPRPADTPAALAALDAPVLSHLPPGMQVDLRSPDQVKSLLRRVGIEVPDTRAWRLESLRDAHPVVDALLTWRRAERVRTTFGYGWLDEHVGPDDRLRGRWSSSDGAAGRMTATAGLHNMPAEMRPAIVADTGFAFVRAALGQIEPRILAAVSGDERLAAATHDDDMYAPVARRLGVERDIAKVAVLGAMYGQTTGKGAEALRGLEREYPVAMGLLDRAAGAAQGGNDVFTFGGRRIRMGAASTDDAEGRSRAAARGRFGRNAVIQGAAAEFFKTWAILVRRSVAEHGAAVVLCLHDELVVHAPSPAAEEVAHAVDDCLQETALRWCPPRPTPVRFVSDTSRIRRWSDAK
ncbi:MAG: DNA polymerase [Ilumatobacter sp.]